MRLRPELYSNITRSPTKTSFLHTSSSRSTTNVYEVLPFYFIFIYWKK